MKSQEPKNHKKKTAYVSLYDLEGSLEDAYKYLSVIAKGLVDPKIEIGWNGDSEINVVGWEPMTEKEIASAEKRRKAAKVASAAAAEKRLAKSAAKDRKEFAKLAKRLGVEVDLPA